MSYIITLVYAKSTTEQAYQEIEMAENSSIYDALQQSGWLAQYPEINDWCETIKNSNEGLETLPNARQWFVGIYSEKKPLNYRLRHNDRIELYRPLTADPMSRRKNRAKNNPLTV